jgi:peptidoglycan/LPS O-acetylase OafA/YrhL
MPTARAAEGLLPQRDEAPPGRRAIAVPLALDVLAVLLFAFVGRRTHTEGTSAAGVLGTAWPFLAGLVTGWGVARAVRRPTSLSTGLVVWVATVAVGMLLRRLAGDGTAVPFVLVATATLGALLLGWRAVAVSVVPRRGPRRPQPKALGR